MDRYIVFTNPGELDLRLVQTFGVSAKPQTRSPIGFFGTGLKYALAVVLRLGGQVRATSGLLHLSFGVRDTEFRGTPARLITMLSGPLLQQNDEVDLPFTTELGKTWEAWMALRELVANTLDEGGHFYTSEAVPEPVEGETRIAIGGAALLAAWERRGEWWLNSEAVWASPEMEFHPYGNSFLYYHGIRASKAGGAKTWSYRYNLLGTHSLTEDRTLSSGWETHRAVARALLQCNDEGVLETVFDRNGLEADLDFDVGQAPSPAFKKLALGRARKEMWRSVKDILRKYAPEELAVAEEPETGTSWEEAEALAPQAPDAPPSSTRYAWESEMEDRMEGLEAQVRFWRTAAKRWAPAAGEAAQIPDGAIALMAVPDPDNIPF